MTDSEERQESFEIFLDQVRDNEILIIPPSCQCSAQQKPPGTPLPAQTDKAGILVKLKRFFSGLWAPHCLYDPRPIRHHDSADCPEEQWRHVKMLLIHHKGQPLPPQYTEQVPPNTLLIVVDPKDSPVCNIFEARPIPLEQLRLSK